MHTTIFSCLHKPSLTLMMLILTSCTGFSQNIRGNGNITTTSREVNSFHEIRVSGAVHLFIKQDSPISVKVQTDENIQSYVITENRGDALVIREKEHFNINPTDHIQVYVSVPDLRSIKISGACVLTSENNLQVPSFKLEASGASKLNLILTTDAFYAACSGAIEGMIQGSAKTAEIEISGAGNLQARNFHVEQLKLDVSGAAKAEVYAEKLLDVDVSGAGIVTYSGHPQVNESVSGAGKIKSVNP
ncbi:head GIN domain-containing protein [Thermoflavifilum thermophilum]|uniref:Putative auto-transporter adhesin, head GIN domain n=1 Tax=Thermoflavifilum thermophilum TaxID=1393122 RepID=A0A1I7MZI3_9BACT|nr:head GIN domain-containing protein [Thermoflavifilum thermophilum]SFV27814.1 Putative auto-transporter adhesin, head GIN domain [Thermoflavifilum thermophilum]